MLVRFLIRNHGLHEEKVRRERSLERSSFFSLFFFFREEYESEVKFYDRWLRHL